MKKRVSLVKKHLFHYVVLVAGLISLMEWFITPALCSVEVDISISVRPKHHIPPSAIIDLRGEKGAEPDKVNLFWTAPQTTWNVSLERYYICYSTHSVNDEPFLGNKIAWWSQATKLDVSYRSSPRDSLSWTVTLEPGNTYYFAMKSVDEFGNISDISNFASAWLPPGPPAAPTGFAGVAQSTGSIKWTWNDVENETGYRVKGLLGENISGDLSANITFWIYSSLVPNTLYSAYVEAYNTGGASSSTTVGEYTLAAIPASTAITAVFSSSVTLSWSNNDNPGYTRWGILRSVDDFITSTNVVTNFDTNYTNTSYTDSGLKSATTYWYKVQAFNEEGIATAFDRTISVVTLPPPDVTPPAAVTDLVALPGETEGKIILIWTAPREDGETGGAVTTYQVKYAKFSVAELSGDTTAWWNQALDVDNEPSPKTPGEEETMNIFGLIPGTTYYFAIKSGDEFANTSLISNQAQAVAKEDLIKPAAVTNLTASQISKTEIKLTWTAPGDNEWSGVIGNGEWVIGKSTDSSYSWNLNDPTNIHISISNVTPGSLQSYVISNLSSGVTYYFAIWTIDEVGNCSDMSNLASVRTLFLVKSADALVSIFVDLPNLNIAEVLREKPEVTVVIDKAKTQQLNLVSKIYEFGPEGTKFDKPVEIVFRYDPKVVANPQDLVICRWNGVEWSSATITEQVIYDGDDPRIVGKITSFSYYAVFIVSRLERFSLRAPAGKSTIRRTFDVQVVAVDNSGKTWTNYTGTVKIFASPSGVEFSLTETPWVLISSYAFTLQDRGEKVIRAKSFITGAVKIYAQDINNPAKSGFFSNEIEAGRKYYDIDGDGINEYAENRDVNTADMANGFEVFVDPGGNIFSVCIATVDANGDGRIDHLINISTDTLPDKYWDPYGDDSGDIVTTIKNMDIGEGKIISLIDINRDGNHEKYYDYTDKKIKDYNDDFDGDGLPNEWEVKYGLNAFDARDAQKDNDGDGVKNIDEYKYKISPLDPDTDKGGVSDGREIEDGTDPANGTDDKKDAQVLKPGATEKNIFVIPYALTDKTNLSVKIYDANGELVKELDLGEGLSCSWDGKDKDGNTVYSGIYRFVVKRGDKIEIEGTVIVFSIVAELKNLKYGPQPFNPEKEKFYIYYEPTNAEIEIKIYSVSGELVRTLSRANISISQAEWLGDNDYGKTVASGVYIVVIKARNITTGKEQLLRLKIVVLRQ